MKKGFLITTSSKQSAGWGSPGDDLGPLRDPRTQSLTVSGWAVPPRDSAIKKSSGWGDVPAEYASTPWSSKGDDQTVASKNETEMSELMPKQGFINGKIVGVPTVALTNWYQKEKKLQLSKDQYQMWNDAGKPHLLRHTAVFVCPLTGEVFASGGHGDDRSIYQVRRDEASGAEVFWYKTKNLSKHGAAARAYDCLRLRESDPVRISHEEPYIQDNAPPLPTLPPSVQEKVKELQSQATERMQVEKIVVGQEDDEQQAFRATYRAERVANNTNGNVPADDDMEE